MTLDASFNGGVKYFQFKLHNNDSAGSIDIDDIQIYNDITSIDDIPAVAKCSVDDFDGGKGLYAQLSARSGNQIRYVVGSLDETANQDGNLDKYYIGEKIPIIMANTYIKTVTYRMGEDGVLRRGPKKVFGPYGKPSMDDANEYVFGNTVFKHGNDIVYSVPTLDDGDTLKAEFSVHPNTDATSMFAILAVYDNAQHLVAVGTSEYEFTQDVPQDCAVEFTADKKMEDYKLRLMIWDDSLVPLSH